MHRPVHPGGRSRAVTELPPLLFLPGLLCDASVFAHQTAALGERFRCIVADFSEHDDLTRMAEAALGLASGPLRVVAHSMGARVALEMVRLAPDRIERLCLMDTGVHPRRDGEKEKRQVLVDLAFAEGMTALARRWLPPMVHPDRVSDAALMDPLVAMVERATPELHAQQIRALLYRPDAEAMLGRIRCPTLLMVGRQDAWSPLSQHEAMAERIPGAELVVIEDAGHMAPCERPEAVTTALVRFLGAEADTIPATPMFDRARGLRGYRLNKMTMSLTDPANRDAYRADEAAYHTRFGLTPEESAAVMRRDWREMVRLGGNVFFLLKLGAITPARMTEIGAHQAGMDHDTFLRERLGKR